MQLGGSMSASVRQRLEHEAAVARLHCEQVSAQLQETQSQLKVAEKEAFHAKQRSFRCGISGEQSSYLSHASVSGVNMTAVGGSNSPTRYPAAPKPISVAQQQQQQQNKIDGHDDDLEPRMRALRRQREALLAETAELRRNFG